MKNRPTQPTVFIEEEPMLLSEAKSGSYEAFEELVNHYEEKIYRLGMNITGNVEDAEDILHATFLKASEQLADFGESSDFNTWIIGVGMEEAVARVQQRHAGHIAPMDDPISNGDEAAFGQFTYEQPKPERQLPQAELEDVLGKATKALPLTFRAVFFLRDVAGLSVEETAKILKLPSGDVITLLLQARLQLGESLSEIVK